MSEVNIYPSKPNGFISQVSIVAAWINFQNEYLFLQRNAKSQEAFRWGVPGGKIELKEEPIAALQREIFEETKVNLIKSEITHVKTCYISKPGWDYTYHMFYYGFTTKPSIEISLEHNDYKWIKIEDIMKLPLMIGTKETLGLFQQTEVDKKKEFYFIRHGQTDHHDNDDYISLNNLGLEQAARAKNLIDTLKISSIYHSPLKRAVQTKDILFSEIELEHIEVTDLAECTTEIWHSVTNNNICCNKTNNFISKAVSGMQMALSQSGSSIVVAHGGIHYAFCKHHNIKNHQWIIDNCVLVHFKRDEESWTANVITD